MMAAIEECQSVSASLAAGSKTVTVRLSSRLRPLSWLWAEFERRRGCGDVLDVLVQAGLVVLDLDDQGNVAVGGDLKVFF